MKIKVNRPFVRAMLVTALGLAVVWFVDREVTQRYLKEHHVQIVDKVNNVLSRLEATLNSRLSLVQGLAAFVKSSQDLAGGRRERFAEAFKAYTDELLKDVIGVRSLQLAPDAVVTYINPLEGNEAALGHNLLADPVRREAAERAIAARHFVVAGPVELRQGGVALIGRLPIFVPVADEEKSERFWGFSIILIDLAPLLAEAGFSEQASGLKFALRGKDGLGAQGAVFFGDAAIFDADPVVQNVILPNGSWQVAALPLEGWNLEDLFPVRAFGGFVVVIIGGLLFVIFSGREKMATNDERRRTAFEAIDEGIWDWNIVTGEIVFSPTWPRIFGYGLDEIEHHVDTWESWLHPDDKAEVMKALKEHFEDRTPYYVSERRMKNKNGAWLWILDRGKVIEWDDGGKPIRMVGADLDITERKQVEEALQQAKDELEQRVEERTQELRESEERFKAVFDNSPSIIALQDTDSRLLMVNRRFEEVNGLTRQEAQGMTPHDYLPKEFADALREIDREVIEGRCVVERELDMEQQDGSVRPRITTKFPVFGPTGDVVALGVHITDITERKKVEEELRQAQKMEAVGQLTGGLAHDFNNLLAVTMTNAQLLALKLEDRDDLFALANSIVDASRRGAELTRRLLAFSRQQTLRPEAIQLGPLCEDMSILLNRSLGETIEIEIATDDETWNALADPGQVQNALLNLAINASRAMPEGGKLTIEVENAPMISHEWAQRWAGRSGDYVALRVTDTGTGIPAQVIEHVFEPFFTTTEVGQGSGLGLSMVYGFAQQSGGFVTVESEEGKGTTVTIYLPKADADQTVTETPATNAELQKGGAETILLVEDDPAVRNATTTLLESLGYTVLVAGDGADALEVVANAERIDLLLSDMVLPGGMNGIEISEKIRQRRAELKCLFMTGYASLPDRKLPEGTELLSKPVDAGELAAKIKQVLDA